MKTSKMLLLISCFGLLLAASAPAAKANEWNMKTFITVRQPIEVPGGVVLAPGRYTMTAPMPNVVEITNRRGTHVYATFFGNSAERAKPTSNTVITVREASAGQPYPLHDWFYPGRVIGMEFPAPRS